LTTGCPAVTEIWVAQGTYKPAGAAGPRTASFHLANSVAMYGGFAGTETQLADRQMDSATGRPILASILSGDLNGDDGNFVNIGDNSYHVLLAQNTTTATLLDGFTILGGNVDLIDFSSVVGAGLYVQNGAVTVRRCRFTGNRAATSVFGQGAGGALGI